MFLNCKIDEEAVAALTDTATSHKLLCQVCLWNCHTTSNNIEDILNALSNKKRQLLFIHENSSFSFNIYYKNYTNIFLSNFSFIFLSNFSLILHGLDSMHIMIFSNPLLLAEVKKLVEVQISRCNISEDTITLLSESFTHCRMIKKIPTVK